MLNGRKSSISDRFPNDIEQSLMKAMKGLLHSYAQSMHQLDTAPCIPAPGRQQPARLA